MKTLTIEELAYIAGFFDGEGTISLHKDYRNSFSYCPRIELTNTNRKIVEWIRQATGLGNVALNHVKDKEKHKQAYVWSPIQDEHLVFLKTILPYLRIKKEQAELLIMYHEKYRGKPNCKVSEEIVARRHEIYLRLSSLNTRGN